jgi:hypothetical protein
MSATKVGVSLVVLVGLIAVSAGEIHKIDQRSHGADLKQTTGSLSRVLICNDNECTGPSE